MGITPAQIRKIKVLQRRAGLDDDGYREMLAGVAGVQSCKDLAGALIDRVIKHLERSTGLPARDRGKGHGGLRRGPQMATERQMQEITRRWERISRAEDKGAALRQFLIGRFRVDAVQFLTFRKAQGVLNALAAMEGRGK